jgi:3-oxo-5alpha-steroid 4-dehydrogenase
MTVSTLKIDDPERFAWDDTADVVVVGFGAAGACAALEADAAGASVILVDKFEGGGATALSGGVVYAGATRFQKEAGFDDTTDEMFKYLSLEVGGIVAPETLRRFCENSASNIDWLIGHGATFAGRLAKPDEAYDAALSAGASLYFSGNEYVVCKGCKACPTRTHHRGTGFRFEGRAPVCCASQGGSSVRGEAISAFSGAKADR